MSTTSVEPGAVAVVAAEHQRQLDVLLGGERRDQVVGLEDEADALAAQLGELLVVELRQVGVADVHGARRERVESGEAVHQGALARARRPHDRRVLALFEGDGDVVEGDHLALAAAVALGGVDRPGGGSRRGRRVRRRGRGRADHLGHEVCSIERASRCRPRFRNQPDRCHRPNCPRATRPHPGRRFPQAKSCRNARFRAPESRVRLSAGARRGAGDCRGDGAGVPRRVPMDVGRLRRRVGVLHAVGVPDHEPGAGGARSLRSPRRRCVLRPPGAPPAAGQPACACSA